ncbi:MAG: hypothetical protein HY898_29425 [Deltaproteobacteria bacterium]|nr:hypothetical protein [Deltaproteobacteria bacterium]
MTPLSRSGVPDSWTIRDLPGVARLSLCLVVSMLFGVPTCLVTSTTEFPQPVPSAPYLDPNTALATVEGETGVPLTKMIFVKPDSESSAPPPAAFKSITLSAQVQSEDNGRPLYARAFGDYQISKSPWFGGGDTLEPSTFEDVRTITATVTADQMHLLGLGCHQLALVVTHLFDSKTFKPVDSKDTGFVVWWILIRDPAGSTPAESCPPKVSVPDGGNMLEAGAQ